MGFTRIPFESPDMDFPKNRIVLLNGNELHCYPNRTSQSCLPKTTSNWTLLAFTSR